MSYPSQIQKLEATHPYTGPQSAYRVFAVFKAMLQRCYDAKCDNYYYYGGRSIRVCRRWRGPERFGHFLADMGLPAAGKTLDRVDNDGNYGPANCRWTTLQRQARNKRNNRYVAYQGELRLLIELAEEHNIPYKVLHQRVVQRGWSLARALSQPLKLPPQLPRDSAEWLNLMDLAAEYGVPYKLLHKWVMQRGWPLERALTEPPSPQPTLPHTLLPNFFC